MNIPKAIEVLSNPDSHLKCSFTPDLRNALKLGIEALKRVKDSQEEGRNFDYQLLPGETKD